MIRAKFLYMEKSKPTPEAVVAWLRKHPNPEDEAVHEWAASEGWNKHALEEIIYQVATGAVKDSSGVGTGYNAQLRAGILVEMEHATDILGSGASEEERRVLAKKIATRHLKESKTYYTDLLNNVEHTDMKTLQSEMAKSFLEKAKGLPVGTIREWKGKKYQKGADGWKRVKKGGSGAAAEEKPEEPAKAKDEGKIVRESAGGIVAKEFERNGKTYRVSNEGDTGKVWRIAEKGAGKVFLLGKKFASTHAEALDVHFGVDAKRSKEKPSDDKKAVAGDKPSGAGKKGGEKAPAEDGASKKIEGFKVLKGKKFENLEIHLPGKGDGAAGWTKVGEHYYDIPSRDKVDPANIKGAFEYAGHTFALIKKGEGNRAYYAIIEEKTGMGVADGRTLKEAAEKARQKLEESGPEKLAESVKGYKHPDQHRKEAEEREGIYGKGGEKKAVDSERKAERDAHTEQSKADHIRKNGTPQEKYDQAKKDVDYLSKVSRDLGIRVDDKGSVEMQMPDMKSRTVHWVPVKSMSDLEDELGISGDRMEKFKRGIEAKKNLSKLRDAVRDSAGQGKLFKAVRMMNKWIIKRTDGQEPAKNLDMQELGKAMKTFRDEDTILWLNKGKGLPVGTIRDWKGKKFRKVGPGDWQQVKGGHGGGEEKPEGEFKGHLSSEGKKRLAGLVEKYKPAKAENVVGSSGNTDVKFYDKGGKLQHTFTIDSKGDIRAAKHHGGEDDKAHATPAPKGDGGSLPKVGEEITIGTKRKQSSWSGDMKSGAKAVVTGYDSLDGEKLVRVSLKSEMSKPGFNKDEDYELVYPNEIRAGGGDSGEPKKDGGKQAVIPAGPGMGIPSGPVPKGKERVQDIVGNMMNVDIEKVDVTHQVSGDNSFWYGKKRIILNPEQKKKVLGRVKSDKGGDTKVPDVKMHGIEYNDLGEDGKELSLFVDNDADLYRQQFTPMIANMARKIKNGTYDHEKAPKLFMDLVDNGARKYVKEHGSPGDTIQKTFPKAAREKVAKYMADSAYEEIKPGNYREANDILGIKKSQEELADLSKALKAFDNEDVVLLLNKGKALPVGTVRDWKGRKYRKTGPGAWQPVKGGPAAGGAGGGDDGGDGPKKGGEKPASVEVTNLSTGEKKTYHNMTHEEAVSAAHKGAGGSDSEKVSHGKWSVGKGDWAVMAHKPSVAEVKGRQAESKKDTPKPTPTPGGKRDPNIAPGVRLIDPPTGKYVFRGLRLDVNLLYAYSDSPDKMLSEDDAKKMAQSNYPADTAKTLGIKNRAFSSFDEGKEFYEKLTATAQGEAKTDEAFRKNSGAPDDKGGTVDTKKSLPEPTEGFLKSIAGEEQFLQMNRGVSLALGTQRTYGGVTFVKIGAMRWATVPGKE